MNARKSITVRLDPDDYQQLKAQARRLETRPSTLARTLVRAGLRNGGAELERRPGQDALERLAALRSELRKTGYPSVDAAHLMREVRADLERRSGL